MSRSRNLSDVFSPDSEIVNNAELITGLVSASAAAVSYVDSEISTIDLSSTIQTASAAAVSYLVDGAPGALNTLNELAAALNDDSNFSSTITNSLSNKLDISSASSTYLSQSNASTTYLTQNDASNTYLSQSNASTTYLSQSSASNLYLSQLSASSIYLTQSASSSFEPNIEYISASPSNPNSGTLWLDSTASAAPLLKVYNGSTWIAVSGADSGLHPFFTAGI